MGFYYGFKEFTDYLGRMYVQIDIIFKPKLVGILILKLPNATTVLLTILVADLALFVWAFFELDVGFAHQVLLLFMGPIFIAIALLFDLKKHFDAE